jgi:hypothetical protein
MLLAVFAFAHDLAVVDPERELDEVVAVGAQPALQPRRSQVASSPMVRTRS